MSEKIKWEKNTEGSRYYKVSTQGYTISMSYDKRGVHEDDEDIAVYTVWPPHKINKEFVNDPYKSHLNALKSLGSFKNIREATLCAQGHFNEASKKTDLSGDDAAEDETLQLDF